jgi:threonine/homoserine/homoserine lactone efflux protein
MPITVPRMRVDLSIFPAFLLACAVVIVSPGMDTFLILRTSLQGGVRAGLQAMAGVNCGAGLQLVLAVSGLGAVVSAHPEMLFALRVAGAFYLGFLAFQIVRGLIRRRSAQRAETGLVTRPFLQGFLSNITNPKMLLFSLTFLPQFIGGGTPAVQLGFLAVVFLLVGVVWGAVIVLGAGRVSRRLVKPGFTPALNAASAVVFSAVAVSLVTISV